MMCTASPYPEGQVIYEESNLCVLEQLQEVEQPEEQPESQESEQQQLFEEVDESE
jgi:hypothetical protein